MQNQAVLPMSFPIVDSSGMASQTMREWVLKVAANTIIVGTGSPEGIVEAAQYSLYIDETTPTAPVQYRKMITSIAGDRKQGWVVL